MKDWVGVALIVLVVMLVLSTIPAAAIGKYQVCKHYFPDINRYACLFTSLPPVPAR